MILGLIVGQRTHNWNGQGKGLWPEGRNREERTWRLSKQHTMQRVGQLQGGSWGREMCC